MAQVVNYLPSKCEVLSSTPSTVKIIIIITITIIIN
jgi:hypothetical protein